MSQAGSRSNPASRPASRPGSLVSGTGGAGGVGPAELQDEYGEQTTRLPLDLQNSCGAVLFSLLGAISVCMGEPIDSIPYYPETQVLLSDGLRTVPLQGQEATFSSLLLRNESENVACQVRNDITLVNADDELAFRAAQYIGPYANGEGEGEGAGAGAGVTLSEQALYLDVLEFERRALVRRQIARLLLPGGAQPRPQTQALAGFPATADDYSRRRIEETEILSFTPLSQSDFYRSHKLLEAHKFMLKFTKSRPNFTGLSLDSGGSAAGVDVTVHSRKHFRSMSALTLAQLLATESLKEPVELKKYYAPLD